MTSIKPADYPSPPKKKCSPKKEASADPFVDECTEHDCRAPDLECLTNSPQDERVSLPLDAERQPLLGQRQTRSRVRRWTMLAGLVLVLVVGGVIAGGVAHLHADDE
jgi:hypothetical protein